MRRTLDIVAITGITAILLFAASPLWAPTYTYVRKEVANVWGAIQTFPYGVTFTSTTQAVNVIGIHERYDANTNCWQTWKDNSLVKQICSTYEVPQDCGTTPSLMPFGGTCKNQTTREVLMMTGSGLIAITGSAR